LLLLCIQKNFDVALLTATLTLLRYYNRYVFVDKFRAQHYSSHVFRDTHSTVLLCDTRNTTSPHVLLCDTRNTTFPCVVMRYSQRRVVMRYSQHYLFQVLLCDTRNTVLSSVERNTTHTLLPIVSLRRRTYRCFDASVDGSVPPDGRILTLVSRLYASLRRRSDKFGMRTGRLCAWGRSHLYP
jgi:hypothetical protein